MFVMTAHTPPPDADLLARFVQNADSAAFSELVERHLGLVYGVACRRTGSREMAQEAVQNTFCRLARHAAKVSGSGSLAPWLHTVALREAGTLLRAERARQRVLHRLEASVGPEASAVPAPLAGKGELDEALASLPEPARRVLILRYLQGLSLRELATAEASTEEAVRKRVSRALERLAHFLKGRGITESAMMGCLGAAPPWPAPPVASIARHALSHAAATPAAGTAWLGTRLPVAAAFFLTMVPAALPWDTILNPRKKESAPNNEPPSSETAAAKPSAKNPDVKQRETLARLMVDFSLELANLHARGTWQHKFSWRVGSTSFMTSCGPCTSDPERLAAVRRAVLGFSREEVRAAVSLLEKEGGPLVAESLFSRWAELEPAEAREAALSHSHKTGLQSGLLGVLAVESLTDPAGALTSALPSGTIFSNPTASLMEIIAARDPQSALRLANSVGDPKTRSSAQDKALRAIWPLDQELVIGELRRWEENGGGDFDPGFLTESTGREEPGADRAEALLSRAESLPEDSNVRLAVQRCAGVLMSGTQPERAADLILAAIGPKRKITEMSLLGGLLKDWQAADPPAVRAWLETKSQIDPETVEQLTPWTEELSASRSTPLPPAR